MEIIPAIDILNGTCVRLRQGDYNAVSVYDDDPAAVAERFLRAGARRLHIVDLDAAKAGKPVNTGIIRAVLDTAAGYQATVQVGGGIRSREAVEDVLSAGAGFVILGTIAVMDAPLRNALIRDYPGRIIIGADVKDGTIAIAGWHEDSHIQEADFFADLGEVPPAAVIYTDISRDGMLSGNNISATRAAAAACPCPLIASGGIGGIQDVRQLKQADIAGVIIGRALYTGNIELNEALALCA